MAGSRDIRDYYDAVAADYDVRHGVVLAGQAYNFETYYAPFLDAAVPRRGRVLEIGCGTGVYTHWLRQRGLDVVAMDLSPPMLDEARRRCPDVPGWRASRRSSSTGKWWMGDPSRSTFMPTAGRIWAPAPDPPGRR